MKSKEYRGRTFIAESSVVSADVYQGVYSVDSTTSEVDDGVINEATAVKYPTREAAEDGAEAAAKAWIDSETDSKLA